MRVLITGAAGDIGSRLRGSLAGVYDTLRLSDIAPLGDANASSSTSVTNGVNVETYLNLNRARHNITIGADVRWQRQDLLSQRDARGTFTFTGAATGVPFADFLLGMPTTSAIGFGNADKRFHSRSYALYVSDDARIRPTITLTLGVRWEHDTPVVEARGRLANLDVAPDFTAVAPITAVSPTGPITGRTLPTSLVTSDFTAVQPRLAVAWRPIPAAPLTIRAGFGVYRNSGLYSSLAAVLAEQSPFAHTAVVARSDAMPLTQPWDQARGWFVEGKPPERMLDRDLPRRRRAQMDLVVRILEQGPRPCTQGGRLPRNPEKGASVEQHPHFERPFRAR